MDKINLKTLTNIESVVDALREFQKNNESVSNDIEFLTVCRNLFERFGATTKIDPSNPGKMADILENLPTNISQDEKLVDILTDLIEPTLEEESPQVGSIALRSDQLKALLDEVDKNRAQKEVEKIAQEATKNRLLQNVDHKTIVDIIIKKIELQEKILKDGKALSEADRISDQILETEQVVRGIVEDGEPLSKKTLDLAEQIVELSENAKTTAEAVELAKSIEAEKSVRDANEMLQFLVETNRASRELDTRIDEIARQVVAEIEKDGSLGRQRDEILNLIEDRYEEVLRHPEININEAKYTTVRGTDGKVKVIVSEKGLADQIIERVNGGIRGSIPGRQERTIEAAVENKLGALATPLTDVTNASTGNEAKSMMEKLTSHGFGPADLKVLMRLRSGAIEPGIEGIEKGLAQERSVKVEMLRQGVPADKIADVEMGTVVTAMLNGEEEIPAVVKKIGLYRELLAGTAQQGGRKLREGEVRVISREAYKPISEMEAVVKVADRLKNRPDLQGRMELIRKIERARNFIDKYSGGAATRAFGNSSIQIGRIMKIEGLQNFGMQLANRYGGVMGEAMASQIINYGFEKGLQNILVQLFRTGTVKAVQVGATTTATATATAGTAAAGTAMAAGGPPTWVIAAAMAIIALGKEVFKLGEKGLAKVLSFLGFDSRKAQEFLRGGLGKVAAAGAMVIGTVASAIVGLGGLLMSIPTAFMGTVFVVVLAALIGYNLLQTASTQISSLVSPKAPEGGGVCVKKSDVKGPSGGKLANCDTGKTASVPGISQDAFVNLAERWSAGGGTNAARCYGAVVCAALAAGKDPTFVLWAWLHESGASNYNLGQIEDFGIHGQGPATNDFNAQIGSFVNLNPGYCNQQTGMDYWLGFATNYLTGTCDPNVTVGSNTGYTYLAEMQQTWAWVSGNPMPASANGSGGATCGGGGSSGGEDEEGSETQVDPNTGEEYICFGGGTLTSGDGAGFPRGTGSPSRGPSSPYPTRDPNIVIPPGCPMGWPVDGNMPITQGSRGDHTHTNIPGVALDIMPTDASGNGTIGGTGIKVTHPGVVTYSGYSGGAYGNLVIVRGQCGNSNFVTYYAHLMDSQMASMNGTVAAGQIIGLADNSGDYPVGNDHLHYEIRGCATDSGGCYGSSGFDPHDYLPVDVPDGCFWDCNVSTEP